MKAAHLIALLFTMFVITTIAIADDVTAEPEERLNIGDMTLSEIFEFYKPLYFPGLCLSVSVFFLYKTIRYSFFKDTEDEKK